MDAPLFRTAAAGRPGALPAGSLAPTSGPATISGTAVRKRYEDRVVLHHLDFSWSGPGILCVRGPNGSGKSTLLSLLAGAAEPDAGDIQVLGRSIVSAREQALPLVSFVPDACPVYPFVTGREWLEIVRAARRPATWTAPALARAFGLDPYLDTRFGAMSLGTARKTLLAAGLGTDAPVVLLDEPSNGLDTAALAVLRERLAEIAGRALVVICCHDVEEQRLLGARCVDLASLEASA
jgi:ABC-type multidrug transport system ATPase subunit